MENSCESLNYGRLADTCHQDPSFCAFSISSLSWFDVRVFYIRISNFVVNDSTPKFLTVDHIPLNLDTLLEVNGARCSTYSEGTSCLLRRDQVDKKSEVATFVSTDSIRLTGSMKFQVFDRDDLVLSGVLDKSNSNGFIGESKNNIQRWSMNCESVMSAGSGFLKGKPIMGPESLSPIVEVYVAGCFSGTPIILTKSVQLNLRKKHHSKGLLYPIPEHETTGIQKDVASGIDLQIAEYGSYYKPENESMYWRRMEYLDGEDGELSWFNAGVRASAGEARRFGSGATSALDMPLAMVWLFSKPHHLAVLTSS
nr:Erythronate-4-phosphate dehydrogenase family protein [Ipomoea batatas]